MDVMDTLPLDIDLEETYGLGFHLKLIFMINKCFLTRLTRTSIFRQIQNDWSFF